MKYFDYVPQLQQLIRSSNVQLSSIKPSDWTEQNVVMGLPRKGPFRYWNSPYCREIIDCFAADHPMKWLAVMKGAQIGLSAGVIIPMLLWMIANDPGNTYFLVGSPKLVEKAVEKLDLAIDRAGLRPLIKPQALRNKSQKTGDTNEKKEFSGGYIHIGSANNHKDIRDVSLRYGLFDDFEAIKSASKESGSTRKMLEQRFAAYKDTHKIAYISTPEIADSSNIEEAYENGDQRKYKIPCPCCGAFIELVWEITVNGITGGMTWETDPDTDELIPGSVKYRCQMCGDKFSDVDKDELLNKGFWEPTARPKRPGYYSYHISSLYAPTWMYGWEQYVYDWLEAHPKGQPRKENLYKTFVNVVLGQTYKEQADEMKATDIMANIREYPMWIVPEKQSKLDGNGEIVLLTCAADMNGLVKGVNGAEIDDARLDYQIVAWSETGACYNVAHGSIGTFIPRENSLRVKEDRERWTYEHGKPNSVWPEFDKILQQDYIGDDGLTFRINMPGLDCGAYTDKAEAFIDWSIANHPENPCVGVRGEREDKYIAEDGNATPFRAGRARNDIYYLNVSLFKDRVANYMRLKWDKMSGDPQPPNFMNFPQPEKGLYGLTNFFEHFESEHRAKTVDKTGGVSFRWIKKKPHLQNHQFDCFVYNLALRDVLVQKVAKDLGEKEFTWVDYCNFVLSK